MESIRPYLQKDMAHLGFWGDDGLSRDQGGDEGSELTLTHILLGKLKIIGRDTDPCFRIRVMPQENQYAN